ncbi:hypothetical protein CKO44_06775 [Rubrivivax gelatinosus]|uniref:diguanylate cyclase domain-containing protein n=1 Tax=Rubrivivax gelatinosus TaxID=28068 RepID=UPI00217776BF|nr:hypothetical protein [Rubrivivax gelatinosus]MBZ8143558.1 hypothetical protein [Rubrivivax gelatinosus]
MLQHELHSGRCGAAFMRDVTLRRDHERQLAAAASTDALTGLYTRRAFEDQATQALARARRSGHCLGLLFLDRHRKRTGRSLQSQGLSHDHEFT